jgi:hypothetical protein
MPIFREISGGTQINRILIHSLVVAKAKANERAKETILGGKETMEMTGLGERARMVEKAKEKEGGKETVARTAVVARWGREPPRARIPSPTQRHTQIPGGMKNLVRVKTR